MEPALQTNWVPSRHALTLSGPRVMKTVCWAAIALLLLLAVCLLWRGVNQSSPEEQKIERGHVGFRLDWISSSIGWIV